MQVFIFRYSQYPSAEQKTLDLDKNEERQGIPGALNLFEGINRLTAVNITTIIFKNHFDPLP